MIKLLLPVICLLIGAAGGYFVGKYHIDLLNKIRTLEGQAREVKAEPTVTMGSYTPPRPVSTAPSERKVGLVESKTPERIAWETEQAIAKEVLGR